MIYLILTTMDLPTPKLSELTTLQIYGYAVYLIPFCVLTVWMLYRNHWPQPWKSNYPPFDETFLKYVEDDNFWGGNPEIKSLLNKMLKCYRDPECHGVILSYGKSRFQMLQFSKDPPVLFKGTPMIPLMKWGNSTKQTAAMEFLSAQKDKRIEYMTCTTEDVFRAFFEHVAATALSKGETDVGTGIRIYRGHLSPKKV